MRASAPHRMGSGSQPASATRPAKIEMQLGGPWRRARNHGVHLFERHQRGDIEFDALLRQALHQRRRTAAARIGDGDLHVNVLAPRGDAQRLLFHFVEVVREDFEGKRPVRDGARERPAERFVIGDARPCACSVGLVVNPWINGLSARSRMEARSAPSAKILTRNEATSGISRRFRWDGPGEWFVESIARLRAASGRRTNGPSGRCSA